VTILFFKKILSQLFLNLLKGNQTLVTSAILKRETELALLKVQEKKSCSFRNSFDTL